MLDENFYDWFDRKDLFDKEKWDGELTERVYLALTKTFRDSLEEMSRSQVLVEIKLHEDFFFRIGLRLAQGLEVEKLSEMDAHLFSVAGWEVKLYEKTFRRVTPWEMAPKCPIALPSQVAKVLIEKRGTIAAHKFGI